MLRNVSCRRQLMEQLLRSPPRNPETVVVPVSFRRHSSVYAKPIGQDFDMSASFTHSPQTGYVRHSAYASVEETNQRIDQFVWQDLAKWQDKIAIVGFDCRECFF